MNTIFEIMEQLKEVTRQINIMEEGFEFELYNTRTNDKFVFQTNDKMHKNVLEYLYKKQEELIDELRQALAQM